MAQYHRCSWCNEAIEASTEFVIVDDNDRCCMDCWDNFGVGDLVKLHGDSYRFVD